jgi:hypothetical protein
MQLRFRAVDHAFMALLGALLFSGNFFLLYQATADLTTGLIAVVFSTSVVMNVVNAAI